MGRLSIICIVIGILAIVFRGPLLFFPEASIRWILKLTGSNGRVRVIGLATVAIWALLLFLTRQSSHPVGGFIFFLGIIGIFMSAIFLIIFPKNFRRILEFFSEMDSSAHRGAGFIGIFIGFIFIYIGFFIV